MDALVPFTSALVPESKVAELNKARSHPENIVHL